MRKKKRKLGEFNWVEIVEKNLGNPGELALYVTALRGPDYTSYVDDSQEREFSQMLKEVTTSLVRGTKYSSGINWGNSSIGHRLTYLQRVLRRFKGCPFVFFTNHFHFLSHIIEALYVLAHTLKDNRYGELADTLDEVDTPKKGVIAYLELLIKFAEEEVENEKSRN